MRALPAVALVVAAVVGPAAALPSPAGAIGLPRRACVATADRRAAELVATADRLAARASHDETTEATVVAGLRNAAAALRATQALATTARASQVRRICLGVTITGADALVRALLFVRVDDLATIAARVGDDLGSLAAALPPGHPGYEAWRAAYDGMRAAVAAANASLDRATALLGGPGAVDVRAVLRLADAAAEQLRVARADALAAKAAAGS